MNKQTVTCKKCTYSHTADQVKVGLPVCKLIRSNKDGKCQHFFKKGDNIKRM